MYDFQKLSPLDSEPFKALVPEKLHCCLAGKDPYGLEASIIAIGVFSESTPVGIALASFTPSISELDIHHLHLIPPHRTVDIGAQLLASIDEEGKKLGAKECFLAYETNTPSTPFYEDIIGKNLWKGTLPFLTTCRYFMPTLNMPWIHYKHSYPKDFEEFHWADLTPTEKEQLLRDEFNHIFESSVSPLINEQSIEPLNSLGIRHEGRVVAWMVTHRRDPSTIVYNALHVEKGLEKYMLGPKLIAHSILLHLAGHKTSGALWSAFEIPLIQVSSSWRHFVEKRLVPYADEVIRLRYGWNSNTQPK